MEFLPDHMAQGGFPDDRQAISEWNVYLPANTDRAAYISNCFLTNTVTLINTNGETVHRVRIGAVALQNVNFPATGDSIGSFVICATSPYSGRLFVLDVYNEIDEFTDQLEYQFRMIKSTSKGSAQMIIDGDNGIIQLSVDHETDGGIVSINISNKQASSQLKVTVNGDIAINATGNVTLDAQKGLTITAKGSTVLIDDSGVMIDSGDNNIFLGGQNQVLYSTVPGATSIADVSQIGVSQKVNVG